jgi:hypothetical protein
MQEWSEADSLRQRIRWMQAEIDGLRAEAKWWEGKYMAALSARGRAIQHAAERGVYIPLGL